VSDTLPQPSQPEPGADELYLAGDVIAGKYQLVERIGEGGMGAVWLARNLLLEVDVAIKLIRHDIASSEVAAKRFLQEARATARLVHAAIVRVHDFGTTEHGDPFLVMEHLRGESLADLIDARGTLPAVEAVQLLLPILEGLEVAHDEGVVHRDLKPENILLIPQGADHVMPKLLDFGVAKVGPEGSEGPRADEDLKEVIRKRAHELTQYGAIMGSPQYMSPEQARGDRSVDSRADLWAWTVMLYELIAGERPFVGDDLNEIIMAVLMLDQTPLDEVAAVDASLSSIVQRGLARDRERRWQSARHLGEALAQWLIGRGVDVDVAGQSLRSRWLGESTLSDVQKPAVPPPPARSVSVLVAAAVAVLLLGTVAVVVALSQTVDVTAKPLPPTPALSSPALATEAPAVDLDPDPDPDPVDDPAPASTAEPDATEPDATEPSAAAAGKPPAPWPPSAPRPKPAGKGGLPLPDDANF
jgi:serine/threonine-protein kinase